MPFFLGLKVSGWLSHAISPILRRLSLLVGNVILWLSAQRKPRLRSAPPNHQYVPLEPGQIRLLRFDERPNSNAGGHASGEGVLGLVTEHYAVHQAPPYLAVSYIWGDPNSRVPVLLNGCVFAVTESLYVILRVLRGHFKAGTNNTGATGTGDLRYIWADAVCINQEDMVEKSQQVASMKDIFRHAAMAYAWTGVDGPDSALALNYLQSVGREAIQRGNTSSNHHIVQGAVQELVQEMMALGSARQGEFLDRVDNSSVAGFSLLLYKQLRGRARFGNSPDQALGYFFSRPFWKRVRILQEVALASRLTFICGGQMFDGHELEAWLAVQCLASCVFMLADSLITLPDPSSDMLLDKMGDHLSPALQLRRRLATGDTQPRTLFSLLELSCLTKYVEATDPRDKVYALSSLLTSPLHFPVDYTLPVHTVFTNAVMQCIAENEPDIILYRPLAAKVDGLPTWVPDLSQQLMCFPRQAHASPTLKKGCFPRLVTVPGSEGAQSRRPSLRGSLIGKVLMVSPNLPDLTPQLQPIQLLEIAIMHLGNTEHMFNTLIDDNGSSPNGPRAILLSADEESLESDPYDEVVTTGHVSFSGGVRGTPFRIPEPRQDMSAGIMQDKIAGELLTAHVIDAQKGSEILGRPESDPSDVWEADSRQWRALEEFGSGQPVRFNNAQIIAWCQNVLSFRGIFCGLKPMTSIGQVDGEADCDEDGDVEYCWAVRRRAWSRLHFLAQVLSRVPTPTSFFSPSIQARADAETLSLGWFTVLGRIGTVFRCARLVACGIGEEIQVSLGHVHTQAGMHVGLFGTAVIVMEQTTHCSNNQGKHFPARGRAKSVPAGGETNLVARATSYPKRASFVPAMRDSGVKRSDRPGVFRFVGTLNLLMMEQMASKLQENEGLEEFYFI